MIINALIKIADSLDAQGKIELSSVVDNCIKAIADDRGDWDISEPYQDGEPTKIFNLPSEKINHKTISKRMTAKQLESAIGRNLKNSLYEAVDFNIRIKEDHSKGETRFIASAVPMLNGQWKDGLILGDASKYPQLLKLINKE